MHKTLAIALSLCATPAFALPTGITVDHPWASPTLPGMRVGAVYATLASTAGDRLVGISTPAAVSAVMVTTLRRGGQVSEHESREPFTLPPHAPTPLSPGGTHIRLVGLTQPLVPGMTIRLSLSFARAGTITIDVPVERPGAANPG